MLVRTKLRFSVAALSLVALICALLLAWSTARSDLNQNRIMLAYESLGGFLQLKGNVYQTFKQARRDLLSERGHFAFDIDQAEQRIIAILDDIGAATDAENKLYGTPDLQIGDQYLKDLNRELAKAFIDIKAAAEMIATGQVENGQAATIQTLEVQIDKRVSALIEQAIRLEETHLELARENSVFVQRVSHLVAVVAVVVAAGLSGFVSLTLVKRVRTGFHALEFGAEKFAANHLAHRIEMEGKDEFATLACRFNSMAQQIQRKQTDLEQSRATLELRVIERTADLREANQELEQRDGLRRQFFADICHELRTPITAIRGEAEVALRAKVDRQEVRETALKTIVSLSEHLTRNVSELFLVARGQVGALDVEMNRLDLCRVVLESSCQVHGIVAEHGGVLDVDLPSNPIWIEGDEGRLIQLISILVTNSIVHSQKGVEITISARSEPGSVNLTVSDNGPGIPADDRLHVFERFYKGKDGKGRKSLGTGLGLPIARSLSNAHGGTIRVAGSMSGGTSITVALPIYHIEKTA